MKRKVVADRIDPRRVSETGVAKVVNQRIELTDEGLIHVTEVLHSQMDCGHVKVDLGGFCVCGHSFCQRCAEQAPLCDHCHHLCCKRCQKERLFDFDDPPKTYHRRCVPGLGNPFRALIEQRMRRLLGYRDG